MKHLDRSGSWFLVHDGQRHFRLYIGFTGDKSQKKRKKHFEWPACSLRLRGVNQDCFYRVFNPGQHRGNDTCQISSGFREISPRQEFDDPE